MSKAEAYVLAAAILVGLGIMLYSLARIWP